MDEERTLRPKRVVRVTRHEFELDDGSIYQHPEPFDDDLTVEEFQHIYDECHRSFLEL